MSKNRKFLALALALCMVFPFTTALSAIPVSDGLAYDQIFRVMDIPAENRPNINMGRNEGGGYWGAIIR